MDVELQALFGAVVVLALTILGQGFASVVAHGGRYGAGARDEVKTPSKIQGRFNRALANSLEGLAMFAPLALIVAMLDASTNESRLGAVLYVAARAVYVPLYVLGVPVVRSIAWGVGLAGTVMVAIAAAHALF